MALVLLDRVQQTGTANTTVSFTLSGSVTGFQSFSVVGNGNTTYYSATDASGNWEVGIGTYTTAGTLLTRTTILSSSNSGSEVTFSGAVNVFVTYPSEKSVNLDASGNATALGTPASGTLTNCTLPYSGLTGTVPTWNQNTTGSAGSVANALTISSPLTGTSYNGSGAVSIGIPAATTSVSGYLTSTDWNTFNGKQAAGSYVTVGGALGTPSSGTLTNCTFPTLNQNTTGSSGSCTGNAATATTANATNTANNFQMNALGVGVSNTTTGTIVASGNITAFSDEKLKKNWRPVQNNFVSKLSKIKSGIYDRTDIETTQAGVSAQSLKTLLPEVIVDGDILSVAYGNAAMVSCVELAKVIEELRAEIELLKAR